MNLPNKLTVLRVIMIPFFVAALMAEGGENPAFRYAAAAIFIIASLTDMLDGKIARKYNLVTNFGKFMDPLADKLLVCSALICMIELGQLPAWMVIIIISREFIMPLFMAPLLRSAILPFPWGCPFIFSRMEQLCRGREPSIHSNPHQEWKTCHFLK